MAERGRPSKFTEELATRICERLAAGETLRAICRDEDMPGIQTVLDWTHGNDAFSGQYARAREVGYQLMADELLEIADDGRNDTYLIDEETGAKGVDHDVIARSRLRVDTRKWLLSKALPKIYGDKQTIDVGGTDDLLAALKAAGERARSVSSA